jgi:adenine-specific DNA methylase
MLVSLKRPRRAENEAAGTIWYMGAKTRLLEPLDRAIAPLFGRRPGPPVLVDLFAGTGVVGSRFAERARIVANDAQAYAETLARAALTPAPDAEKRVERLLARSRAARQRLAEPYAELIREEARFLEHEDVERYRAFIARDLAAHDPENEAARVRADGPTACIATAYFRNVYFGVAQAVAIDALRGAIEAERGPRRTLYLAALLFAVSRATSGTAHFAQPRGLAKASEIRAMIGRRRIDVEALFRSRVRWLAAEAGRGFAGKNEVHRLDHDEFFARLRGRRVDVVYADPPYTRDQYSRFYHVLETLVRYDYPRLARNARGAVLAGRYPELTRRFQSRFTSPATVEGEFRRVTAGAADLGAALVWSYSRTNGLLLERWGGRIAPFEALLRERYRRVSIEEHALRHSGQGDKNHAAAELIAVCSLPM